MGLFGGGTKQSGASSSGAASSGIGAFNPENNIYMAGKPLIDFNNPFEIAAALGIAFIGFLAWRKFK